MVQGAAGQPIDCPVFAKLVDTFAAVTQTILRLHDEKQIHLAPHLVPYVRRAVLDLLASSKALHLHLNRTYPDIPPLLAFPGPEGRNRGLG